MVIFHSKLSLPGWFFRHFTLSEARSGTTARHLESKTRRSQRHQGVETKRWLSPAGKLLGIHDGQMDGKSPAGSNKKLAFQQDHQHPNINGFFWKHFPGIPSYFILKIEWFLMFTSSSSDICASRLVIPRL